MSDYIPTTESVLATYIIQGQSDDQRACLANEFGRWHKAELRKAKAAGWDEGFDAGWDEREDFAMCGAIPSGRHQSEVTNPYRDQIEEDQ